MSHYAMMTVETDCLLLVKKNAKTTLQTLVSLETRDKR